MKVKLIYPNIQGAIDILSGKSIISDLARLAMGMGRTSLTPPLSLLMIAAATPQEVELKLIDERIEKNDLDEPVDLIGVSVLTQAAPRAYDIAQEYHKRGVKVVFGGIHPSALPQDARPHCDAMVLGEGEGVWPQLLNDFQRGNLQPVYRGQPQIDLDVLPFPRRELLQHPEMYATTKVLMATRGCENTCTFCSAGIGLIKKYRKRSVASVVRELEEVPGKIAAFLDDNLGWDVEYTKDLMKAMIPLRLKWTALMSMNAIEDRELIELAAKSGCFMIGVGLESLSSVVITQIHKDKTNHPERYASVIKQVQQAGIAVWGSFVVGFDEDTPQTFKDLRSFIDESNIAGVDIHILAPCPGSVLYRKYEQAGRLLHKNWQFYDSVGGYCIFQPKQMTPKELVDGYLDLLKQVYSWKSIGKRMVRAGFRPSLATVVALHANIESHQSIAPQKISAQLYRDTMLVNMP